MAGSNQVRGGRPGTRRPTRAPADFFEALEARTLLSASLVASSSASLAAPDIQGFTPAQIRHAYGFDSAGFNNGAVAADGQGQTIAIVDPYDDPKIASDLSVFDAQFNLPGPPSLKVVDHAGGNALPRSDAGWASEIALDVEWAHAIAPRANILLVEAASDGLDDLLDAVRYARTAAGVTVVSMSWGGSEFFGFKGKEFSGEIQDDSDFLTPAGHGGVTFVTAAGDDGPENGAGYPGESPNVLTVGGTTLTLSAPTAGQGGVGDYGGESTWLKTDPQSGSTGGGYSQIEPEPAYQLAAQNTGARSSPDVAYDANPNTGFAVYDSIPDGTDVGWQDIGGNSAGTPQWAALVALADQGRALAGAGSLDGATQTLPALYSLYAAPGTAGYANYTSYFNDVIDTSGGAPSTGLASAVGYDTATGLGSPRADRVIAALVATTLTSPSSPASPAPTSPSPTPAPTPTPLPASPLGAAFTTSPPAAIVVGDKGSLALRLTNESRSRFAGPVSVQLYASTTAALPSGSAFASFSFPLVRLRPGGSKVESLHFTYPTGLPDASYYLAASVDAVGTNTEPAEPVTAVPARIAEAKPDLAATFAGNAAVPVRPGRHATATVTVQNLGNLKSSATLSLNLYASPGPSADPTADPSARLLVTLPARRISLRPGQSKDLRVRFIAPKGEAGGTYFLAAALAATQPPNRGTSTHVAFIGTLD